MGKASTCRHPSHIRPCRFGKLVEIHFNQTHHICGAKIRTYLLEKSRVVSRRLLSTAGHLSLLWTIA